MNLINVNEVPVILTDQMREIDDIMINKLGISLLQMMENAGRNLARLACKCFLVILKRKKNYNFCGFQKETVEGVWFALDFYTTGV